jgi:16S rRNA (cytosine1402-N4)-methyltransferase
MRVVDGTLGGGGHSEMFLEAGSSVLGIDRDPEALAHARARLARFGDRFEAVEGSFGQVLELAGAGAADGLLLDLGVSSRQLDEPSRGFSFALEGPLDMRMGPSAPWTAAEVVNGFPEDELERIFRCFGEEPAARRIARAIARQRDLKCFETTTELADCIERVLPRQGRLHPATRVFQAVRMVVNDELGALEAALRDAAAVLRPGGRLLVITFHSIEDRLVKQFLRRDSAPELDHPTWPAPRPNPDCRFRLLARQAILPTPAEAMRNPRARSAKLRLAERLDTP